MRIFVLPGVCAVQLVVGCVADSGDDALPEPQDEQPGGKSDDPAEPGPEVRLTEDSAFSHGTFCYGKSVVASGDVVHVILHDDRSRPSDTASPPHREIYYKRSTDRGATWGPDVRLTDSFGASQFPSLAVAGALVHVVWLEERDGNLEVYYKRSTDGGTSWGQDVRLTTDPSQSLATSVVASGSAVHVAWFGERDGNWEIYYKRSTDGGSSWEADTRLTSNSADSWFPSLAVSGQRVHVAWQEYRDGNPEIYYKRSENAGATWGPDTRLTFDATSTAVAPPTLGPSISASGTQVHVVWSDPRDGNQEIYDKRSMDGGVTWLADERLTDQSSDSTSANVSIDGDNVDVVWNDERDGNDPAITEIYHRGSTNGGVTWGPETRVTFHDPAIPLSYSIHPSVFVSGPHAHLFWTDSRDREGVEYDGNYEVYYRRLR